MKSKIFVAILLVITLGSCNVTRTVTTTSESHKKGDTTFVIQTKTIESYNAVKNENSWLK